MSQMPDQVVVGPYRYRVQIDQAAVDAASLAEGSRMCGTADHYGQLISLSPTLGPDARAEVLVHECFHAIFEQTRLIASLEPDMAERIIEGLGYATLDLIRRNPDLVAFLTDGGADGTA